MNYLLSSIADLDCDTDGNFSYKKRTAPLASRYGLGIELAEFGISDNLDGNAEAILPHFEYNRASTELSVLHAPYNELFPHAIDRAVVQVARKRYDMTWELCKKYNIKKIVAHANYVHCLYYPEWFISKHIDFWTNFLNEHSDDITVCLENVMEPYPSLITDIVKGVGDERLRMCLDIGHANLTSVSTMQWLESSAPYISHFHIHNNMGPVSGGRESLGDTHSPPGNGIMDINSILDRADTLVPDATATIESCLLEESVQWLKENGYI